MTEHRSSSRIVAVSSGAVVVVSDEQVSYLLPPPTPRCFQQSKMASSLPAESVSGSPKTATAFSAWLAKARKFQRYSASASLRSAGVEVITLQSASPARAKENRDFPRVAVHAEPLCCDKISTFAFSENFHGARILLVYVTKQKLHSRNCQSPAVKSTGYAATAQLSDSTSACSKTVSVAFSCLSGG